MPFAKFTHVVLEICKLSVHTSLHLTLFCQKPEGMKNCLAFLLSCVAETGIRYLVGKNALKIVVGVDSVFRCTVRNVSLC